MTLGQQQEHTNGHARAGIVEKKAPWEAPEEQFPRAGVPHGPRMALGQLEEMGFSSMRDPTNSSNGTTTTLPYQGPPGPKGPPGPEGDSHVTIHMGITWTRLGIEFVICALAVLAYAKCVDSYIIKGIGPQAGAGGDGPGGASRGGSKEVADQAGGAYGAYDGAYGAYGADGGGQWAQGGADGGWAAAGAPAESQAKSEPFAMPTGEEAEKSEKRSTQAPRGSQVPRRSEARRSRKGDEDDSGDDKKKKKKKKKDDGWFGGLF